MQNNDQSRVDKLCNIKTFMYRQKDNKAKIVRITEKSYRVRCHWQQQLEQEDLVVGLGGGASLEDLHCWWGTSKSWRGGTVISSLGGRGVYLLPPSVYPGLPACPAPLPATPYSRLPHFLYFTALKLIGVYWKCTFLCMVSSCKQISFKKNYILCHESKCSSFRFSKLFTKSLLITNYTTAFSMGHKCLKSLFITFFFHASSSMQFNRLCNSISQLSPFLSSPLPISYFFLFSSLVQDLFPSYPHFLPIFNIFILIWSLSPTFRPFLVHFSLRGKRDPFHRKLFSFNYISLLSFNLFPLVQNFLPSLQT